MSIGKRRLSLIAAHLKSSTPIVTSRAHSTLTTAPSKIKEQNTNSFRERSDYQYFLPIQTRWSDNDNYNHLNNSVYYHYFDTIINEYLIRYCGLDIKSTDTTKPIGLVVSSQANFYASASYPSLMTAGLCISKIGNSSVTYRVGVFENEEPLACVVGGFTHVFVDPQSRRPVKGLPIELLKGMEKLKVE